MDNATLVVPPIYEAQMVGVYAIEITARKLHQRGNCGNRIKSCARKVTDDVGAMSFLDLISLINTRAALQDRS